MNLADKALEFMDALADRSPVVIKRRSTLERELDGWFELGRDYGASAGPTPPEPRKRHLHAV